MRYGKLPIRNQEKDLRKKETDYEMTMRLESNRATQYGMQKIKLYFY